MRLKRTMSVLFFCTIFMLTSITVFAATKNVEVVHIVYIMEFILRICL